MKKLLSSIILVFVLILSVVGCGKKEIAERNLFNLDLEEYVTLGEYSGITVDTSSDDYKSYYDDVIAGDVENNSLYDQLTEGKVQSGDIANIDYEGKKDGVAFSGGTAEGYDLEIGSGSFIDGFEEGLIGVEVGKTVDLNLTFPENYGNEELNGADVVFTVTVNSIKRAKTPENYYTDLEFMTLKAYEDDVKERAAINYLLDAAAANSKVSEISETDAEALYNASYELNDAACNSYYNMDFETYLSYNGMTLEAYKTQAMEYSINPQTERLMAFYAIMDKEEIACTQTEIDAYAAEMAKEQGTDAATLKEYYGNVNMEVYTVNDIVGDFLYKNAVIK